ncbi:hypothetical protein BH11PLA2_BH11PLA2_39740 [soil metagenome]
MRYVMMVAMFGLLATLAVGCTDKVGSAPATKPPASGAKAETKHDEWWCAEHGIPEAECSLCSPKFAKECKAKGDWCEKHERAQSQCFICDPKLKETYAAKYRTKYGKEPPPIEDEAKK